MRYEIVRLIGRGGMGEVFLARDRELERYVALKFVPDELRDEPKALSRLHREAKAAARLDHPFICKVYEVGETEEKHAFIAMEYVDGETLAARIRRGGLPGNEALRIAMEIAEALAKAHHAQIVHRDLKPENVMIGTDGHAKVMDFGLAKEAPSAFSARGMESDAVTREAVTESGALVGTPRYMSPEQLRGNTAGAPSDLFAFGVLLVEMLTGRHPFDRDHAADTMAAILTQPPRSLDRLPDSLSAIVTSLLAKEASERPTLSEVMTSLRRSAGGFEASPSTTGATLSHRHVFVGRDTELARLRDLVEQANRGGTGLVLLAGEPGVGKTRLAHEALRYARERGFLVLEGHCHDVESAQPYHPWVECLEAALAAVPKEHFREALGDDASEVAKIFPELQSVYDDIPDPVILPPEQQRRYLFRGFQSFVERLTQLSPVAWLLDDLHWADESSLQLLQHLVQHSTSLSSLIIGTYRDVELEVGKPFEKSLSLIVRQRLGQRVPVKRLSEEAVLELLSALARAPAPRDLCRAIFRETEGNPFFVEEVFAHLRDEYGLLDTDGKWNETLDVTELDVPEGVRLVIGRRLERLGEQTPKVLSVAAVIGRVFELDLLEGTKRFDSDSILDALEEAQAAQLVSPIATARRSAYQFTHELIRQTLLSTLSLPRRQRIHLAIGEALERRSAPPVTSIAEHLYLAGSLVEVERTVKHLQLAGDRALEASASEEALHFFERAILLTLEEIDDPRLKATLFERRAEAHHTSGDWQKAMESWSEALPLLEELGDEESVAHVCAGMSFFSLFFQQWERSLEVAQRGLRAVSGATTAARCLLLAAEGLGLSLTGRPTEGDASLKEAVRGAELIGDDALLGEVLRFYATHFVVTVDPERVRETASRAAPLLLAQKQLWAYADALNWQAFAHFCLGQLEAFNAVRKELEPLADRVGHGIASSNLNRSATAAALMESGSFEAWEEGWRRDGDFLRRFGFPFQDHHFLNLGRAAFWRGDWDRALELMEQAEAHSFTGPWHGIAQAARFLTKAYAGHDDALKVYAQSLEGGLDALGHRSPGGWWGLVLAVEGLAILGERDLLSQLYPRIAEAAHSEWVLSPIGFQQFKKAGAIAAAACRRFEDAEDFYEAALEQAATLPIVLEQPEVRRWYATMLIDRDGDGDRDAARRWINEAMDGYERLGMPRHLEMTRALASRL